MQQRLFPGATFSAKSGEAPHFKAFATDSGAGAQRLLGIAFLTMELAPFEPGYDGPIKMLVGMDIRGVLTRHPFQVGSDADAVSGATLTTTSATRAIKTSERRAATAHLTSPSAAPQRQ